eukprot:2918180-Prymnesium_polylepis.2
MRRCPRRSTPEPQCGVQAAAPPAEATGVGQTAVAWVHLMAGTAAAGGRAVVETWEAVGGMAAVETREAVGGMAAAGGTAVAGGTEAAVREAAVAAPAVVAAACTFPCAPSNPHRKLERNRGRESRGMRCARIQHTSGWQICTHSKGNGTP